MCFMECDGCRICTIIYGERVHECNDYRICTSTMVDMYANCECVKKVHYLFEIIPIVSRKENIIGMHKIEC